MHYEEEDQGTHLVKDVVKKTSRAVRSEQGCYGVEKVSRNISTDDRENTVEDAKKHHYKQHSGSCLPNKTDDVKQASDKAGSTLYEIGRNVFQSLWFFKSICLLLHIPHK